MKYEEIECVSDRLILKPYQLEDQSQVYKLINDRAIYETTLYIPYPYPEEYVGTWLRYTQNSWQYDKGYEWGVFSKDEGYYLGNVGIVNYDLFNNSGEITYFIGSHYWGKGYATEAVQTLLKWAIEELGLERIVGRCMIENKASRHVMEKCGFLYEGRARHEAVKEGHYIDIERLALLAEDYYKGVTS